MIRSVVNKIQYAYYTDDGFQILQNRDELLNNCLETVIQKVRRDGHTLSEIGPASFSFLEPFVTPYINHSSKPRVIAEIVQSDIPTLLNAGIQIGERDARGHISLKNVVIRTVFGASEQMPLRSLSYLLPALHIVEALRKSNKFSVLPQIQYIVMAQSGIDLNELDRDMVYRQTELLVFFGNQYVRQFYPELTDNVVFAHDESFLSHSEVESVCAKIKSNPQSSEALRASGILNVFEQKGKQNVFEYFVRHPLVHDIPYTSSPFASFDDKQEVNCAPELLINIGGQREKLFYTARRLILNANTDILLARQVQLFSHHRTPPYMRIGEEAGRLGDISIDEIMKTPKNLVSYLVQLENRQNNNLLHRDYNFLMRDTDRQFVSFVEEMQKAEKSI